jgi:hypothetical protein
MKRDPVASQEEDASLQLELFEDTSAAAASMSDALAKGRLVAVFRSGKGFELIIAQQKEEGRAPSLRWLGPACGFSKRSAESLVRCVAERASGIWARALDTPWNGWSEWGTLARNLEVPADAALKDDRVDGHGDRGLAHGGLAVEG